MRWQQGEDSAANPPPPRRDWWNGTIVAAALLLFVGTGGTVGAELIGRWRSGGAELDRTLVIALLLNVALVLFGWRRHRALSAEITLRIAAEARAYQLAGRDPLTGFLNRRSLAEDGTALLMQAARRYKVAALLMIDLDHFKTVNDLHGHATGDALLRHVAGEIVDALPGGALAARIGGDEFACLLLFDASHPEPIERIAERIIGKLAQPFRCEGLSIAISASIGIARSDQGCASIDSLLRGADIALYEAKKTGRDRFAWFDRSMERAQAAHAALEANLRKAIPGQEIAPYFEQQIDLATGALCGFEVLARWEKADGERVGPAVFVPVAERTGMIADLSLSVMQQAFVAARDWDPALTLAINLSPRQLKDAWLAQKIIKLLTEAAFPPNRLEIEVTEAALTDNLPLVQSTLSSLKNQGVTLVLDDFGSGTTSIAHLRAAAFDRIKVSRTLITTLTENGEHAATVNAIAAIGECFNLPITAVGIETPVLEERLRALGCARGQGFHYGQPASVANTRRLLAGRGLVRQAGATGTADGVRMAR